MSETVCKNCGEAKSQHVFIREIGLHICGKSFWEGKPEPLKAKPGVRYRFTDVNSPVQWFDRIGSDDGRLAFTNAARAKVEYFPMSPDWVEVPE